MSLYYVNNTNDKLFLRVVLHRLSEQASGVLQKISLY